jgi:hypothetical protein
MASAGSRHVWTRLTHQQVRALLALAARVDHCPTSLRLLLPEVGQRAAFRGAVKELERLGIADNDADTATGPQPVVLVARAPSFGLDIAAPVRRAWGLTADQAIP